MKRNYMAKRIFCLFLILLLAGSCTLYTVSAKKSSSQETGTDYAAILENAFSSQELIGNEEESEAARIDLETMPAENESSVPGVRMSEESVLITEPGTYLLGGSMEGTIIVDAGEDDDINLILDGVTIRNDSGAAIYVRSAGSVTITLKKGTDNTLINTGEFQPDGNTNIDGVIFSKSDLFIDGPVDGSASLLINSAEGCGIVSKDSLFINSSCISIDSKKAGIEAKNDLLISDASITIESKANGIKGDGDTADYGNIYIRNSDFSITSDTNAFKTSGFMIISGGSFHLVTGGGCPVLTPVTSDHDPDLDDAGGVSAKGFAADGSIAILNGDFTLDCADDGIHSENDILIQSGTFSIRSADDALHGRERVTIQNGYLTIYAAEGLEGTFLLIKGGTLDITASGDGMNAANKSDTYHATAMIDDGTIHINLIEGDNDGIDSNGNLYINGGTIEINGALNAFDYLENAEYNGGTIIVDGEVTDHIQNQT